MPSLAPVRQVLVLTHEDAKEEELMPYMAVRCRPAPVLEMWGRSAKRDPPCRAEDAVFHWWRDHSVVCLSNVNLQYWSVAGAAGVCGGGSVKSSGSGV
jgi:hypothetical protein